MACTAILFTLIHCYKKKIGLFRQREETRLRTSSFMVHVRTLSDRLDSTASRIRVPSGNSVWDNGRTVKVVAINRIRSGNRRRGGDAWNDDAEELVQLNSDDQQSTSERCSCNNGRDPATDVDYKVIMPEVKPITRSVIRPSCGQRTIRLGGGGEGRVHGDHVRFDIRSGDDESDEKDEEFLESEDFVKPHRTFTV